VFFTWQINSAAAAAAVTSGPRGKGIKRKALGSKGQSSRSHKAEDRFGGIVFDPFGVCDS